MLDDYIPCRKDTNGQYEVAFSSAHGNELWVILLEKAWAKLHGDYVRIIGGLSHETFRDLTGAPSYIYQTQYVGEEQLWDILMSADQKNYMMACGVSGDTQQECDELGEEGLINGHAYSLINCAQLTGSNGI